MTGNVSDERPARERPPVDLAVGQARQRRHGADPLRHGERGNPIRELGAQFRLGLLPAAPDRAISDEHPAANPFRSYGDARVLDAVEVAQRGFEIREGQEHAVPLHAEVLSADDLYGAVGPGPGKVRGAIPAVID